jgi:hypothetical protein
MLALHGVEGAPPPAAMQARFDEGHKNEPVIMGKLLEANPQMVMQASDDQMQVELEVGGAVVRGHIDGIIQHGPNRYLVEAKALGKQLYSEWEKSAKFPSRFPEGGLWDKYALQTSVYHYALGKLPICFVVGEKDDNGDVQGISFRWYAESMTPLITIMQRVLSLELLAKQGMPKDDCTKGEYPCPYYQFHAEKIDNDVLVLDDSKLEDLIREVNKKREYAKVPAEAQKQAEQALKDYVREIGRAEAGMVTRAGKMIVKWHHEKVPAATVERKAYTKDYFTITQVGGK